MNGITPDGMDQLFRGFCDDDGVLRDHGLTSLLQSANLDQGICNMLVSRAQWLSEHYGSVCLTRDDFDLLLSNTSGVHGGERHGIRPLDAVGFRLGGVPSQTSVLLTAARLGLEVENDVKIASERLSSLRHPLVLPIRQLPLILDPPESFSINPPLSDVQANEPEMPLL